MSCCFNAYAYLCGVKCRKGVISHSKMMYHQNARRRRKMSCGSAATLSCSMLHGRRRTMPRSSPDRFAHPLQSEFTALSILNRTCAQKIGRRYSSQA